MFGWVLNTPLFLDGCYLHGLSSLYVDNFVPEYFKNVVSRSQCSSRLQLQGGFIFQIQNCLSFLDPKYIYEMAICCIIVITSYNNVVRYKLNTFFLSKLEVNWRKKLKPLTDAALYIFFQKAPLKNYVWILFSHIYSIFCDLELFQTRVDSC